MLQPRSGTAQPDGVGRGAGATRGATRSRRGKALRKYRAVARLLADALAVDRQAVRREWRYDGKYVLHTNTGLAPDRAAQAYKQLWRVEAAFRTLKSSLDVRPIYHWTERRVRGHVMGCFLALVLDCLLQRKLRDASLTTPITPVAQPEMGAGAAHRPAGLDPPGPHGWQRPTRPSAPSAWRALRGSSRARGAETRAYTPPYTVSWE